MNQIMLSNPISYKLFFFGLISYKHFFGVEGIEKIANDKSYLKLDSEPLNVIHFPCIFNLNSFIDLEKLRIQTST